MFDQLSDGGWEESDGPEELKRVWAEYLVIVAHEYGLLICNSQLTLPKGQNPALLIAATFKVFNAKELLLDLYPELKLTIEHLEH